MKYSVRLAFHTKLIFHLQANKLVTKAAINRIKNVLENNMDKASLPADQLEQPEQANPPILKKLEKLTKVKFLILLISTYRLSLIKTGSEKEVKMQQKTALISLKSSLTR
ncbi:MAG: hypothetical protein ACTHXT_00010 [Sphingobacterium sp.]